MTVFWACIFLAKTFCIWFWSILGPFGTFLICFLCLLLICQYPCPGRCNTGLPQGSKLKTLWKVMPLRAITHYEILLPSFRSLVPFMFTIQGLDFSCFWSFSRLLQTLWEQNFGVSLNVPNFFHQSLGKLGYFPKFAPKVSAFICIQSHTLWKSTNRSIWV
jgi:hypothetical protein